MNAETASLTERLDRLEESLHRIEAMLETQAENRLSSRLEELTKKTDIVADQTADIHQFVPFVGWLNSVANVLPSRFLPPSAQPAPALENE